MLSTCRRAAPLLAWTAALASITVAPACTSGGGGGGGGGFPCALDGTCPVGMVCAGTSCVYDGSLDTGGGAGSDAAADAASGNADADDAVTVADAAGDAAIGPDAAADSVVDTGPDAAADAVTDAGADSGQPVDAGGTKGSAIAGLQQGTASLVCAKTDGEATTLGDVTLEDGVATSPIAALGSLRVFYVRPDTAPAQGGAFQGIKVVVFGKEPLAIDIGDRVRVRGDLVEYFCETEIKTEPAKIELLGKAPSTPQPYPVAPAQVAALSATSETLEGVYVEVQDVVISNANVLGTDGKPHGTFAVVPAGSSAPELHIAPSAGTTFTKKDGASGETLSIFGGGEAFAAIRGHVTYSFGSYQLRPTSDADLIAK